MVLNPNDRNYSLDLIRNIKLQPHGLMLKAIVGSDSELNEILRLACIGAIAQHTVAGNYRLQIDIPRTTILDLMSSVRRKNND